MISLHSTADVSDSNWSYGLYSSYSKEDNLKIYPLIGYSSERLNWYGPKIDYKIYDNNNSNSNSNSNIKSGLEYKDETVLISSSLNTEKDKFGLSFSLLSELDENPGSLLKYAVYKKINFGPIFTKIEYGQNFHNSVYENMLTRKDIIKETRSIKLSISTPIFLQGFTIFNLNISDKYMSTSLIFSKKF